MVLWGVGAVQMAKEGQTTANSVRQKWLPRMRAYLIIGDKLAYVLILRSSTSSFVSVNVEIIVRNVTINDVQLQKSNLEFGIPPISYT